MVDDSRKLSSKGYPRGNKKLQEDARKLLSRPETKRAIEILLEYLNDDTSTVDED